MLERHFSDVFKRVVTVEDRDWLQPVITTLGPIVCLAKGAS